MKLKIVTGNKLPGNARLKMGLLPAVLGTLCMLAPVLTGCSVAGDTVLADVPLYPGAEVMVERQWTELPDQDPCSYVDWCYYLAGDKYQIREVYSFYETELSRRGWQKETQTTSSDFEKALWQYHLKISQYIPGNAMFLINTWGYFSRNDGKDWIAVWIGVNKPWAEADRTLIVALRTQTR